MKKKLSLITALTALAVAVLLSACQSSTPKPRGYFRIELPPKTYQITTWNQPYQFEYPSNQALLVANPKNANWNDLVYPRLNARIYLSYKPIQNNFQAISEDAREFVYKHAFKADAISEQPYINDSAHVYGLLYEIKGNTASQVQFVVTDSTQHFLRGALYFNNRPNKDSLAPVIDYIKEDIYHLIETTKFTQHKTYDN